MGVPAFGDEGCRRALKLKAGGEGLPAARCTPKRAVELGEEADRGRARMRSRIEACFPTPTPLSNEL